MPDPSPPLLYRDAVQAAADACALRLLRAAIAAAGGRPEPAIAALGLSRREYYRELARLGVTHEAERARLNDATRCDEKRHSDDVAVTKNVTC